MLSLRYAVQYFILSSNTLSMSSICRSPYRYERWTRCKLGRTKATKREGAINKASNQTKGASQAAKQRRASLQHRRHRLSRVKRQRSGYNKWAGCWRERDSKWGRETKITWHTITSGRREFKTNIRQRQRSTNRWDYISTSACQTPLSLHWSYQHVQNLV